MNLIKETFLIAWETTVFSIINLVCLTFTFTSLQVNRLLLQKFPMLSLPLLPKIQQGGVDALKALKIVHEKGSFSCGSILMIDEMYMQKPEQYQSGNLSKGIVAFMVVGFKLSIPLIVQTIPEVTFNEKWLAETFIDNIDNLIEFRLYEV